MSAIDVDAESCAIVEDQAALDLRKYLSLSEEERSILEAQAELDKRKAALEAEQQRIKRSVDEHFAEIARVNAEQKRELLREQHRAIVPQCRAAREEYEGLIGEAEQLQREHFQKSGARENAERQLLDCRRSKPAPESYPTDEELQAWSDKVKRREEAFSRANKAEGDVWRELEPARRARNAAREKYQRLADKEADLRERLNTEPISQGTIRYGSQAASVTYY